MGHNPRELYASILMALGSDEGESARRGYSAKGAQKGAAGGKGGKDTAMLNQFGRDLTEMAREGKLDPVIGRDKEIERHRRGPGGENPR